MAEKGGTEKEEYIFSKRDIFITIYFGFSFIIFTFLIWYFIYVWIDLLRENFSYVALLIFIFMTCPFIILDFWFMYWLLRRKLIINNKGIKFFIGNKPKFNIRWSEILYFNHLPLRVSSFTIILHQKETNRTYHIDRISKEELQKAYDIMKRYGIQYKIMFHD
jgi:hypothetical protein